MKYGEKVDVTDCQRFENVTDVTRQNKCMYAADTVHSMISLSKTRIIHLAELQYFCNELLFHAP